MPAYRIHRLKDHLREQFRTAAHTGGVASVRLRDYREGGVVEAPSLYAAWSSLRGPENALAVGDLLEAGDGALWICKYVGFEQAKWFVPEPSSV